MKRWLWFVAPFATVLAAAFVAWVIVNREALFTTPEPPHDVTFDTLDLREPWVRLEGTAHYESVIVQRAPATLFEDESTWHLFGFFPKNDTMGREIPVLVRTRRAPEKRVSFETMTVEGRLSRPSKHLVPPQTETILSKRTPYFFADGVVVIEAHRILSEDGTWVEPGWEEAER